MVSPVARRARGSIAAVGVCSRRCNNFRELNKPSCQTIACRLLSLVIRPCVLHFRQKAERLAKLSVSDPLLYAIERRRESSETNDTPVSFFHLPQSYQSHVFLPTPGDGTVGDALVATRGHAVVHPAPPKTGCFKPCIS